MKTGHTRTTCPDNWRRYHATISASSGESSTNQKVVIPPKEDLLQNNNPWCCNCAKQGHYVHQCRAYRFVGLKLNNSKRNDNYIVVSWVLFFILPSTSFFQLLCLPSKQSVGGYVLRPHLPRELGRRRQWGRSPWLHSSEWAGHVGTKQQGERSKEKSTWDES